MKMYTRFAGMAAMMIVALASPAKASLPYYDFAFSIDAGGGDFITGEIVGLEDNATSVPYDIVINSDPFNAAIGAGNYSLKDNGFYSNPYIDGRFSVVSGVLTGTGPGDLVLGKGVSWAKQLSVDPDPYSQIDYNFSYYGSFNGESFQPPDAHYGNSLGDAGVTYAAGTISAVPEPSQWGFGIFLAVVSLAVWKRFSFRSSRMA